MRRFFGILLVITGVALLAFVGFDYAVGSRARDRARASWDAITASKAIAATGDSIDLLRLRRPLAHGAPIGRLLIPSIGLDEVVVEGVDEAQLEAGPGHVPESVLPGEDGNAVISAHRDRHFHSLGTVTLGDTVITETLAGLRRWVVSGRRIAEAGQPAIFPTNEPVLTLTTCWPIRYVGPAPDRLLLTAKPVQ
ncbi:MAG TPA: class D sortase [Gemmatimonadaceae bacterium]